MHRKSLRAEALLDLCGAAAIRQLDFDEPVVRPFFRHLLQLVLFSEASLLTLLGLALRERDRCIQPLFRDWMPACDRDLSAEPLGGDELSCDSPASRASGSLPV